jgi:hypothetical protein
MLVAIISAKRPHQVEVMESALHGLKPIWYVPSGQVDDYNKAGAKSIFGVEGTMPMKSKQLNQALNEGFNRNEVVVTLDDDYHSVKKTYEENNKLKSKPYSLSATIKELADSLLNSPFHLAGVGPSLNAFFSGTGIKNMGKVNGQLSVQTPNIVRYDENLKSQVDFEYCLAHHAEHKGVIIHKSLLVDFHLYGRNESKDKDYRGGLAGLRTDETNAESARVMSERYGIDVQPEKVGESRKKKISYRQVRWAGKPSWTIK